MDLTKVNHKLKSAYVQLHREIRNGRTFYEMQPQEWKETIEAALYLQQIDRRLTAYRAIGVILFTNQTIK